MKEILLILFLVGLLTCKGYGQVSFLNNFNFEEGGYSLLGLKEKSDPHELSNALGEWYTDDIEVLNKIKKEWIFKDSSPQYLCGYHYVVYVCKNGNALESFYINLNCNEIVGEMGYFYFDVSKLSMFQDQFKKPVKKQNNFMSLRDAKKYRLKILKNRKLIMTPAPLWTKYEGRFAFEYKADEGFEVCFEKVDSILNVLKKEITNTFPEENFSLQELGTSNDCIEVRINCNKSLHDKFNLYPLNWRKWEYFKLNLISYWKNSEL